MRMASAGSRSDIYSKFYGIAALNGTNIDKQKFLFVASLLAENVCNRDRKGIIGQWRKYGGVTQTLDVIKMPPKTVAV